MDTGAFFMYSIVQLISTNNKRLWIMMDIKTNLPLLYPLRYHVDHLAYRSLSTQSASLQAIKFFYEFWLQKHGTTFCYSFYTSGHNPIVAIEEMAAFYQYLVSGRLIPSNAYALPLEIKTSGLTNAARIRAVIQFIAFLINTYISPSYQDGTPKELSRQAARLHTRLMICTHWVEPLAIPLVENIFETVKTLTEPLRNHLTYLREKAFVDYLAQPISDLPGELIELDEIVAHIAQSSSQFRGRGGRREKANKALTKRGIPSKKEVLGQGNSKSIYFTKTDISRFIKNEFDIKGTNNPCTHAWKENGKYYEVNYEDLLFLHTKGTLALRRTLALVATPIPLDNNLMNKFLGNVDSDGSVFSKYQLLEDDGTPTRLRTHIPRHNINTFLAIAEVSDHLQAMLMGRMDITQNRHYQHLALAERRKVASLIPSQSQTNHHSLKTVTPVNMVKHTRKKNCVQR
jgi:hypothetical protein